ncbi:MAG: 30S ribosomal protein S20 [Bdellovibrionia bacterium]
MANHKSAAKRARQAVRKNAVNNKRRSAVKTAEKSLAKAITGKTTSELNTLLSKFTSQIMKVAKKGSISKQTAARKVARLSKQVHNILGK